MFLYHINFYSFYFIPILIYYVGCDLTTLDYYATSKDLLDTSIGGTSTEGVSLALNTSIVTHSILFGNTTGNGIVPRNEELSSSEQALSSKEVLHTEQVLRENETSTNQVSSTGQVLTTEQVSSTPQLSTTEQTSRTQVSTTEEESSTKQVPTTEVVSSTHVQTTEQVSNTKQVSTNEEESNTTQVSITERVSSSEESSTSTQVSSKELSSTSRIHISTASQTTSAESNTSQHNGIFANGELTSVSRLQQSRESNDVTSNYSEASVSFTATSAEYYNSNSNESTTQISTEYSRHSTEMYEATDAKETGYVGTSHQGNVVESTSPTGYPNHATRSSTMSTLVTTSSTPSTYAASTSTTNQEVMGSKKASRTTSVDGNVTNGTIVSSNINGEHEENYKNSEITILRVTVIMMIVLVMTTMLILYYTLSNKFGDMSYRRHEVFSKETTPSQSQRISGVTAISSTQVSKKNTDVSIGGKTYKVKDADIIKINIPDDMDVTMYTNDTPTVVNKKLHLKLKEKANNKEKKKINIKTEDKKKKESKGKNNSLESSKLNKKTIPVLVEPEYYDYNERNKDIDDKKNNRKNSSNSYEYYNEYIPTSTNKSLKNKKNIPNSKNKKQIKNSTKSDKNKIHSKSKPVSKIYISDDIRLTLEKEENLKIAASDVTTYTITTNPGEESFDEYIVEIQ